MILNIIPEYHHIRHVDHSITVHISSPLVRDRVGSGIRMICIVVPERYHISPVDLAVIIDITTDIAL